MSLISSLVGAGASLIGNIFGASNTKKTNDSNFRINQLNNEFNERMMHKQMDYNTMMWNKTNAYNTPLAQRERLEDAGFNPYMMLNGGSSGNASAAGSTSAASASSSSPQQSFSPDLSGIPQSILMAKQGRNIDENTQGMVIDNQSRNLRNMQEIASVIADTKNKDIQRKLSEVQYSYADQMQMTQLANQKAQTQNLLREGLLMDKSLAIFDERTRLELAQMSANILLTSAQTRQTKQQTVHEIQKMIQTTVATSGMRISNDVAKRIANALVDRAYNEEYYSRHPSNVWQGGFELLDRLFKR